MSLYFKVNVYSDHIYLYIAINPISQKKIFLIIVLNNNLASNAQVYFVKVKDMYVANVNVLCDLLFIQMPQSL